MGGAVIGQNMVEVMKIMATSLRRSHACAATLSPLTLKQATTDPHLHWRLLDTSRPVWISLLLSHYPFLLGPDVHKVLFVPSKSLFPQSHVSSGGSIVGSMATFSKRTYAIPRSAALRAPAPVAGHCWYYLHRRHSNTVLAQYLWCLLVLVHTRFGWALQVCLVGMGFDSKHDFAIPIVSLGLLLCPCMWGIFFWWNPTISWVGKILWKRKWQPTPVFLPGESHGQRSLAGGSPWWCKSWTWLNV